MNKNDDYQRVSRAINYLEQNPRAPLKALAEAMALSESHCHKLFHRWAGITPKQFQRFLQRQHLIDQLDNSRALLEASWEAGLSGAGRLHDLMVHWEGMTPGQYRASGKGAVLSYGEHLTPLGPVLIVTSPLGLCHLSFINEEGPETQLEPLKSQWANAEWRPDQRQTRAIADQLFRQGSSGQSQPPALHLRGTAFQHKVWQALLAIPEGRVCSYGQLARAIGCPGASRAVGTAVGANPIALIIPCHRVLRQSGEFGGYRWGRNRKVALLSRELFSQSTQTKKPG